MSKKNKYLLFDAFQLLLSDEQFHTFIIDQEKKNRVIECWQKHFVPKQLGRRDALWHSFIFEDYPHLSGLKAVEIFNKTYLKKFVIFSTHHYHAIECNSTSSIHLNYKELLGCLEKLPSRVDIFICQHNLKWTFVVTHEEGFGPYFAYATNSPPN